METPNENSEYLIDSPWGRVRALLVAAIREAEGAVGANVAFNITAYIARAVDELDKHLKKTYPQPGDEPFNASPADIEGAW